MSFRTLQYILALADTGHFGKAADSCNVNQSTLSLQIKRLEDYLGVALFNRDTHPVATTEAGREIVALARITVQVCQAIKETARHHRSSENSIQQFLETDSG